MANANHDSRTAPFETQRYAGFTKGMNNILADGELPADALRSAVNVDVYNSGLVRRRKGTTLLSATACHSLWTNGSVGLCYSAGALNNVNDDFSLTALVNGLAGRPISFTEAGLDIYWSDSLQNGRISSGVAKPWGVEVPAQPPGLASHAGSMVPGTYQAAVTFITAEGEESAASRTVSLVLSAGGLTVTIPQPTESAVTHAQLYLSQANGDVLYHVAMIPVGTSSVLVMSPPDYGQVLRTQFMARFLPCEVIEHWRGRIYGAIDNVLYCTEPYAFGLYRPSQNFYMFPSKIRLVIGVTGGLYVVCDKTYWLQGTSPQDFTQRELLPYGAAQRSVCRVPESTDVAWFSDRGIVVGDESGKISPVQSANVLPGAYTYGATVIREQNGIKQAISVVRNPVETPTLPADAPPPNRAQDAMPSRFTAGDFMDAEIIKAS
jgi:hypothetical protein